MKAPSISVFEKVVLLAERARELSSGATPAVRVVPGTKRHLVARSEYEKEGALWLVQLRDRMMDKLNHQYQEAHSGVGTRFLKDLDHVPAV